MYTDDIPAFSRVCKYLRNNKLSLNTVKIEFMIIDSLPRLSRLDSIPESTTYAAVAERQAVKMVKLNIKWSFVAMVTALTSYFYF